MALEKALSESDTALVNSLENKPSITVHKRIIDRGKVVLCLWKDTDYCYQYVGSSFTNYATRRAFEDTNRRFNAYVTSLCNKKLEELYRRHYGFVFPHI